MRRGADGPAAAPGALVHVPMRRPTAIQHCFVEWHDANARRFLVPVRRGEVTLRSLRLDFPSFRLEDTLYAALRESEITVYAAADGEVWGLLVSLDLVVPEQVADG